MPENSSTQAQADRSSAQEKGRPEKLEDALKLPRGAKTICIHFDRESYSEVVEDPERFRRFVDETYTRHPELFPEAMDAGYRLHDARVSAKLGLRVRRIELTATEEVYGICPAFVMPYMVGYTADVENALFLVDFGVPYWALTHVFGHNDMYWYRLTTGVGRNSIVGTTVKHPQNLPHDVSADEKHTKNRGKKVYAAVTVGENCVLGAAMCRGADAVALSQGYGVFAAEARNLDANYRTNTVNTDGWAATKIAWETLFPTIVIIQCFLHAFLKVRDRCRKRGDLFMQIGAAVWDAYHAPNKRAFSQRIRRIREWAQRTLGEGIVRDKLLALCDKAPLFALAYDHPTAHRTSNMVDRLMRWQDRFLFNRQYFHRSWEAVQLGIRAWAILRNFRPLCPRAIGKRTDGACAAERLNGFRYCDDWLENLRVSSSMCGYRQ
jgi:hypothetical protein